MERVVIMGWKKVNWKEGSFGCALSMDCRRAMEFHIVLTWNEELIFPCWPRAMYVYHRKSIVDCIHHTQSSRSCVSSKCSHFLTSLIQSPQS